MKRIVLLIALFSCLAVSAQDKGVWDNWQRTSCYSKIAFRLMYVGKNGTQYQWKVQFKNDYPQLISFNYNVTDKLQQYNITTHRKSLEAKQVSPEIEFFTKEEDIFILVDKVSLSPYPENFVDCDH